MMETTPLSWKVLSDHDIAAFTCFILGCQEKAEHLAKIRLGEIILRICLCNECQLESPENIVEGVLGYRATERHSLT